MGNVNRRPSSSRTTAQPAAQWDEANVLRLISENKLAPKQTDKLSIIGRELTECPICFLEFPILNTVHCCKQFICTDCVVQLKSAEGKGACPFCGNAEMHVSLIPVVGKRTTTTNNSTPAKGMERSGSVSSDADAPSSGRTSTASASASASLTYLTPEQDKRLRTYSLDAASSLVASSGAGATPSSGGAAPAVARKADREALERQIREQRLQFDERDLEEAAARTSNRRGGPQHQSSAGYGTGFGSAALQYRLQQQQQQRAARHRLGGGAGAIDGPAASYMGAIEGLLQRRGGVEGISSLQQLEDIMLMEAIRLSMQDASPEDAGPSMGPSTTGSSVSDHLSAPIVRQGGALGGAGSQSTTEANSSIASAQPSPPSRVGGHSAAGPARAAGQGNRYFYRQDGHGDEGDDGDEVDDLEDEDQLYEDYEGDDGEAGEEEDGNEEGNRESDLLSDEDEQLRLAMALSLSSLRAEQQQQQQGQQQGQQSAATVSATEAANQLAPQVDASGKITRSGVKSDDTRPALAASAAAGAEEPESPAPAPCFRLSVLDPLGLFSAPLGADEASTTDAAGTKPPPPPATEDASGATVKKGNVHSSAEGPVLKMPADDTAA